MRNDDFEALVAMQRRCFPGMDTWTRDHIKSQLARFPEGQLCIEIDSRLAASSCSLIVVGGRIPGYGAHADEMSAREYVERVTEKAFHDPVLTPQLSNGFTILGLIPGYFAEDSASRMTYEWTQQLALKPTRFRVCQNSWLAFRRRLADNSPLI